MRLADAERRAAWIAGPCAVVALAVACAPALREEWAPARELWLARATGWVGLAALALSLCVTPAHRLVERTAPGRVAAPLWPALRRALGLCGAAVGGLHLAVVLATQLRGDLGAIVARPFYRAGLGAMVALLPLALTSFPRVNRAARVQLWKPLHRLAYLAGGLALLHALLSPFAPRAATLAVGVGVLGLGLLRLLPARRAQG